MEKQEQLQTLYDDMGRPGVRNFLIAAKRKGIELTEKEAKDFVGKQSIGQVFQGKIKSDGKVAASAAGPNFKFQIDLIDFSKRISKLNAKKSLCLYVWM